MIDYTPESLAALTDSQVRAEHANQRLWMETNAQMVGMVGVELGKMAALDLEINRR